MPDASVSFAGNPTDHPEVHYTEGGIARATLRVAASGRREQEPSFFTVTVWRDQAKHAAESLSKGNRVVVMRKLQQRAWTAEDGSARSTVEVLAEELGRACDGRRRPRPGQHPARIGSQLARCDGAGREAKHANCSAPSYRAGGTGAGPAMPLEPAREGVCARTGGRR